MDLSEHLSALAVTPELNLGTEMALYPGCALRLYRNNAGTPLTTLVTGTVADVVEHGTGISQVISLNTTMREEQQKESRGVFHDEEWSEEHNKTYDGTIYVRMSDITRIVDIDLSLPDMQGYIPFEQEIQNALITGPALHYLSPGCQVICKVNPFRLDNLLTPSRPCRGYGTRLRRTYGLSAVQIIRVFRTPA
ncbi:hypothetical protein B0H11DRAFT_1932524 [Mycena galericulata]|nr:hypothetical protein B0H11DRAFT_1932524 [Mycena galericulata]